jgi:hypothetical protein
MTSYWSIIPTRMMDSFQTFQGTLTTYTGAKLPTSRSIYTEMQLDSLRNEGWCGANRAIFDRQVEWAGGTGGDFVV